MGHISTELERIKQSVFNRMRRMKIKNFSDGELERVFKHCKEQVLHISIVKIAIDEGLTIASLYEPGLEE